ncbi:MAG: 50S ribosomal protein L6 [Planctomycetota bacterium]|nr:MAG: 50S ribosomal protein L6 [Planctomycetota bacterium]
MSRVGKLPITVPNGVTVTRTADRKVSVKGSKGTLELALRAEIEVAVDGGVVRVTRTGSGDERESKAMWGTTRALISKMIDGVTKGYERRLEIVGVGWNAQLAGNKVVVAAGFCKPVEVAIPKGVNLQTPSATSIVISGPDAQAVGQLAAKIRKIRPPEPYKGKGVRYADEVVRRKAGKSFGS